MKEDTDGKTAFFVALNKVQGLLEPVTKDSTNPHFKSKYASLGAVNAAVMGPLSESGFVLMSGGVDIAGKPYLRTTLSHIKGHSESFDYPIVNDGNPQHIASSITYARRYAICSMFNLSVEDDDGNMASTPKAYAPVKSATLDEAKKVFEPRRETPKPTAARAAADGTVTFVPALVTKKEGESARGKWIKYGVKAPDGKFYGTFFEGFGLMAETAKANGTEVTIGFKEDGKFFNIETMTAAGVPTQDEIEAVPF